MATVFMAVAALIAATLLYVKRRDASATKKVTVDPERQRFHAVAVRPGEHACRSAQQSNGTRYLSREAPHLPLPGCNEASCTCRFVHFADRRTGDDRRTPFQHGINATLGSADIDRREQADRRQKPANDQLQFG